MSKRNTNRHARKPAAGKPEKSSIETRIDPPHVDSGPPSEIPATVPAAVATEAEQPAVVSAAVQDTAAESVAEAVAAPAPAQPEIPPENVAERLRVQAEQLAAHLRWQQNDLDHRQSQLNARLAEMDRDERQARLWVAEREADLRRRAEELAAQEQEVRSRLDRLAAAEAMQREPAEATPPQAEPETQPATGPLAEQAELRERAEALNRLLHEQLESERQQLQAVQQQLQSERQQYEAERQQYAAERQQAASVLAQDRDQMDAHREAAMQQIQQLVADVERRREAVEAWACEADGRRAEAEQELLAREALLRRSSEAIAARQRQLDESESRLDDGYAEIEQLREQLLNERREAQEDARAQRQQLAAEHRRTLDELEKKRQAVVRRADHVDRCRLALKQLRGELGRMHRETLEIRLATEELWVQLSGAAPPAALTHSLGRIRSKLADHYRLATAELQEQKGELESIRGQMSAQYEKLLQQKRQFEQWAAAQRDEAEQQAARLIAREELLHEKEAAFDDRAHRWQSERLQFQHEIRRLQARVPRPTEATLTA